MSRELTNVSYIKDLCQRYGFALQKGYGQNFIVNAGICPKIAEHAEIDENCGVIEIGTGIGVLTKELALRAKKVVAIEIDTKLLPLLEETLADFDNIKIINKDVLEVDLNALIKEASINFMKAVLRQKAKQHRLTNQSSPTEHPNQP